MNLDKLFSLYLLLKSPETFSLIFMQPTEILTISLKHWKINDIQYGVILLNFL